MNNRRSQGYMYPPHIREEYYAYCRNYMKPIDLLKIQSTAIIHLKYIQSQQWQQDKNISQQKPLLSKLTSLFSHHGTSNNSNSPNDESNNNTSNSNSDHKFNVNGHVQVDQLQEGPVTNQYFGPPVPPSILSNPIELVRHYDELPKNFWTTIDRFSIRSRPRMAPPPIRLIYREPSSCERRILLTKLCKKRAIEFNEMYEEDTIRSVLTKITTRRVSAMRKRSPLREILKSDYRPAVSSPLALYNYVMEHQSSSLTMSSSLQLPITPITQSSLATMASNDSSRKSASMNTLNGDRRDSKMDAEENEKQRLSRSAIKTTDISNLRVMKTTKKSLLREEDLQHDRQEEEEQHEGEKVIVGSKDTIKENKHRSSTDGHVRPPSIALTKSANTSMKVKHWMKAIRFKSPTALSDYPINDSQMTLQDQSVLSEYKNSRTDISLKSVSSSSLELENNHVSHYHTKSKLRDIIETTTRYPTSLDENEDQESLLVNVNDPSMEANSLLVLKTPNSPRLLSLNQSSRKISLGQSSNVSGNYSNNNNNSRTWTTSWKQFTSSFSKILSLG